MSLPPGLVAAAGLRSFEVVWLFCLSSDRAGCPLPCESCCPVPRSRQGIQPPALRVPKVRAPQERFHTWLRRKRSVDPQRPPCPSWTSTLAPTIPHQFRPLRIDRNLQGQLPISDGGNPAYLAGALHEAKKALGRSRACNLFFEYRAVHSPATTPSWTPRAVLASATATSDHAF